MSAPSFSSFPPVFDSFPDLEAGSSSSHRQSKESKSTGHGDPSIKKRKSEKERSGEKEKEERTHDSDKRKRKREKKHNRKDDEEREHSSRHRKKRSELYDEDGPHGSLNVTSQESFNRFFYIGRKGDELNIRYGSLHSGDVPKYWHVSRGKKVLGLEPHLAVLYRGSKGLEIGEAGWFNRSPQLTDSRSRSLLASGDTRRLTATNRTRLKYEEVDGFIRVSSRKRKGKEKDQAYRAISLDDKDESDSDSSSQDEGGSSAEGSDVSPMSAREETLRNLEQRLANDPTSESMWLFLLHHSISGIDPSSKNADRARAEISVSVLERALSAHQANARSPLLRLKYLKAGEVIWDMTRMKDEWRKALKAIPTADMHVDWLDWTIRSTPDFSAVVEYAIETTNLVSNIGAGEDADFAKLRVFWRVATSFRQAGYVERGFALLQAQAELSFNIPREIEKLPFEKQLDSLEEFWESEVPRIGEAGAKGWRAWRTSEDIAPTTKLRTIRKSESSDPFATWYFKEAESDRCLIYPSRMPSGSNDIPNEDGDEDGDDDPYAAVLFSDIRPFLVDLRTAKGRDKLRLIWLSYLGLHIPGLSSALSTDSFASDDRWADTHFLQPSSLKSLLPQPSSNRGVITADAQTGVVIGREKTYAKSFDVVKSWSLGVLEPFEGLTVDGEYRMWIKRSLDGVDSEIVDVMRRILRDVRHENDFGVQLNVAELAFEAALPQSDAALKRSQALLSENSTSAQLLASHAYLERIRRKWDKARKVYRVGLQSLAKSNDPDIVYLWWDSAEMEWLLSKNDAALGIVLRSAGQPNERSDINVLRSKRRLEELCQQNVVPKWRHRLKWIKLRVLLECLVGTLDTTIEVMQKYLATETPRTLRHESMTVVSLLMVYHHTVTLHNPAPPSILRGLVREALEDYPSNSIVIGLFLECEKGESVWGRVRTMMSEKPSGALREKSVARRLIEVWIAQWEEGRWLGEVERVRAGLEAAVTSDRTKGSPILWKVYVKFEIAAGNVKRAKSVLFRALKECPLVKELYLLAFEDDLRNAYTRRELITLSDTMAERGIRLRHSLGEVLEIHGVDDREKESDTSESGDEYEDELEYESRERKRLMPY
ncbi:hypothetical protein ACEPAI_821 [Sanghuangporus weigelae]